MSWRGASNVYTNVTKNTVVDVQQQQHYAAITQQSANQIQGRPPQMPQSQVTQAPLPQGPIQNKLPQNPLLMQHQIPFYYQPAGIPNQTVINSAPNTNRTVPTQGLQILPNNVENPLTQRMGSPLRNEKHQIQGNMLQMPGQGPILSSPGTVPMHSYIQKTSIPNLPPPNATGNVIQGVQTQVKGVQENVGQTVATTNYFANVARIQPTTVNGAKETHNLNSKVTATPKPGSEQQKSTTTPIPSVYAPVAQTPHQNIYVENNIYNPYPATTTPLVEEAAGRAPEQVSAKNEESNVQEKVVSKQEAVIETPVELREKQTNTETREFLKVLESDRFHLINRQELEETMRALDVKVKSALARSEETYRRYQSQSLKAN
eukprot:TRINITY_DN4459_c0_g1_i1.p1 TRINITY_DN4459_c0_g1~~TRINITY_DN4459_c0_g1_i1.p1  ORF type:complete len:375 (+),score=85.98 TRINITY_DN4459_c0_g1_i1:124-1248(+)